MKKILTFAMIMASIAIGYADDKPSFPGGEAALNKYISENTHYPEISKENGVEGIVSVGFIVATDGSVKNPKVMKMVDPDLEQEAIRIVTGMPAWIPAEKDGNPVEAPAKVDVPFIMD